MKYLLECFVLFINWTKPFIEFIGEEAIDFWCDFVIKCEGYTDD